MRRIAGAPHVVSAEVGAAVARAGLLHVKKVAVCWAFLGPKFLLYGLLSLSRGAQVQRRFKFGVVLHNLNSFGVATVLSSAPLCSSLVN